MEKIGEISIMPKLIPPYVSFTVNMLNGFDEDLSFWGLQHSGLPWRHQGTSHIGQLPLRQAQQNPDQGAMVYHTWKAGDGSSAPQNMEKKWKKPRFWHILIWVYLKIVGKKKTYAIDYYGSSYMFICSIFVPHMFHICSIVIHARSTTVSHPFLEDHVGCSVKVLNALKSNVAPEPRNAPQPRADRCLGWSHIGMIERYRKLYNYI